jgi:thiamine biosynthesis protein ThiS
VLLTVNGEAREVPAPLAVDGLIEHLGINATVAVEHNGTLVRRADRVDCQLSAGDRVEIVHFVGGG